MLPHLLQLVAHHLSVIEVEKLSLCNRSHHRQLSSESYWSARAQNDGATERWLGFRNFFSWKELYHGRLVEVTDSKLTTHPSDHSEESLVLYHNEVAWDIRGQLFLVHAYGHIRCNLSQYGVHPRPGGIVAVRSSCYGHESLLLYLNQKDELWMFAFLGGNVSPESRILGHRHCLLLSEVALAGASIELEPYRLSLLVCRKDGRLCRYESFSVSGWKCRLFDTEVPDERFLIDESSLIGSSLFSSRIVQICNVDDRFSPFVVRDSDSVCHRFDKKQNRWLKEGQADICQVNSHSVLACRWEQGWSYLGGKSIEDSLPQHAPDLMWEGVLFYHVEGKLISASDYHTTNYGNLSFCVKFK